MSTRRLNWLASKDVGNGFCCIRCDDTHELLQDLDHVLKRQEMNAIYRTCFDFSVHPLILFSLPLWMIFLNRIVRKKILGIIMNQIELSRRFCCFTSIYVIKLLFELVNCNMFYKQVFVRICIYTRFLVLRVFFAKWQISYEALR